MSGSQQSPSQSAALLTADERQSLRETVDVAALETFLRAAPKYRRGALLHFAQPFEPEAAVAAMSALDAPAESLAALDEALRPQAPDEVAIVLLRVAPPQRQELRALWDAIEPAGPNPDGGEGHAPAAG